MRKTEQQQPQQAQPQQHTTAFDVTLTPSLVCALEPRSNAQLTRKRSGSVVFDAGHRNPKTDCANYVCVCMSLSEAQLRLKTIAITVKTTAELSSGNANTVGGAV
jgi:hypothetical protein